MPAEERDYKGLHVFFFLILQGMTLRLQGITLAPFKRYKGGHSPIADTDSSHANCEYLPRTTDDGNKDDAAHH